MKGILQRLFTLESVCITQMHLTANTNTGSKIGASSTALRSNHTPNPSINTDWRDKAAPAGYVKR